jgi:hypothetical protein
MKKTTKAKKTTGKKTTGKKTVKATAKSLRAKRVRKAKDLKPIPPPHIGMLLKISEMDQRLITGFVEDPGQDRVRYVKSVGSGLLRRGTMSWSKVPKTATVIEHWA